MAFFERVAWGGDFQGLLCLGTPILAPLLYGDLLGVDLLRAVIQGCLKPQCVCVCVCVFVCVYECVCVCFAIRHHYGSANSFRLHNG